MFYFLVGFLLELGASIFSFPTKTVALDRFSTWIVAQAGSSLTLKIEFSLPRYEHIYLTVWYLGAFTLFLFYQPQQPLLIWNLANQVAVQCTISLC